MQFSVRQLFLSQKIVNYTYMAHRHYTIFSHHYNHDILPTKVCLATNHHSIYRRHATMAHKGFSELYICMGRKLASKAKQGLLAADWVFVQILQTVIPFHPEQAVASVLVLLSHPPQPTSTS